MSRKRFNVFEIDGTIFLEDHIEGSYHIGEFDSVDVDCLNRIAELLNKQDNIINTYKSSAEVQSATIRELMEENKQLKKMVSDEKCGMNS